MAIVRNATRGALCMLPIACIGVIIGCSFEAPALPTFETQIRIPIAEKRYSVAEFVEDIDTIVVDSTEVRLEVAGDIDTIDIDDELEVTVAGTSFSAEIGPIQLPDIGTSLTFGFAELAPPGTPTGSTVVPPFAFSPPERNASGIAEVSSVTFAGGDIVLRITNNLPVPLAGACAPTGLDIVARDADSGDALLTLVYTDEIAPGETIETRSDLTGKTMGSVVSILLSGCSAGSGGQEVEVSDTDHVALDVSFDTVTAESAVAEVSSQSFGTSGTTTWDDDMPLRGAAVLSGGADVTIDNDSALAVDVALRFPGFTDSSGDSLGFDFSIPAGAPSTTRLDFSGVMFASADAATEIPYVVRVTTPGSGGSHVSVTSTDGISVGVGDIALAFAWLEGVPPAIDRGFGPFEESLEWPEEAESFRPARASIVLEVTSEVGASAVGTLSVVAGSGSQTDSMSVDVTLQGGALGSPVTTTIEIDETNSRILDLLAFQPTTVRVAGTFTVGDGVTIMRLDRGAELSGSYELAAPFAFTIDGGEIELDAIRVELDQEVQDLLIDNVGGVSIETVFSNGFPFGAAVIVSFATDSTQVYTSPSVRLDALSAEPAAIDPVSGKATDASESVDLLRVDAGQIESIAQPNLFVGVNVTLEPSNGVVELSPRDEVVVTTVLTLDVTVDDTLIDGNGSGR